MGSSRPSVISPANAEAIIHTIREGYGLGGAYKLDVTDNSDGTWTVTDGLGRASTVRAMGERAWRHWFQKHYGDVIEDRLETSEA